MMKQVPYRTLSSFLREKFGKRIRKITLDASLGCPNRDPDGKGGCIYCNTKGSGTGAFDKGISLQGQIKAQMASISSRSKTSAFIAYFQSYSNTYGDITTLKNVYDTILPYPQIVGLAVGTRPDCIDAEKLSLISSYGSHRIVWMEYGLQSAHDVTLRRINRGHDVRSFVEAVKLTSQFNVRICVHVILGLPGEDMHEFIKTAKLLSGLPVTDVKIHLLYVVRGTLLEQLFEQGQYSPMTLDAYTKAVAAFIAHLRDDIVIQRITGDPHAGELIAPSWALDKVKVRDSIHKEMEQSNIHQGSMLLYNDAL